MNSKGNPFGKLMRLLTIRIILPAGLDHGSLIQNLNATNSKKNGQWFDNNIAETYTELKAKYPHAENW